jgi:hypothetical protein
MMSAQPMPAAPQAPPQAGRSMPQMMQPGMPQIPQGPQLPQPGMPQVYYPQAPQMPAAPQFTPPQPVMPAAKAPGYNPVLIGIFVLLAFLVGGLVVFLIMRH